MTTSLIVTFYRVLLTSVVFQHAKSGEGLPVQDEYFAKRIGSSNATSLSADGPGLWSLDRVVDVPCPVECFLRPPNREIVVCGTRSGPGDVRDDPPSVIQCSTNRQTGHIRLGNRESVRTILPGTLGQLTRYDFDTPIRTGSMSLHLNFNMMRVYARSFAGLDDVLTAVSVMNVMELHPDSFIDLRYLHALSIDTKLVPRNMFESYSEPIDLNSTETPNNFEAPPLPSNQSPELPNFIRLRPLDMGEPISFNVPTTCHQCTDGTEQDKILVIVVFSSDNNESPFDSYLNLLVPSSCPFRWDGLGCVANFTLTSDGIEAMSAASTKSRASGTSSTPSYLIFLSIWCLVLTTVVIGVILTAYICTQRMVRQKAFPSWLGRRWKRFRRQPAPDLDDRIEDACSHSSASSGDYPPGPRVIQPMLDSQTTWCSWSYAPGRASSAYCLKDKPCRPGRYSSSTAIQCSRGMGPKRRSIGSQTNFADPDADPGVSSTLGRSGLRPFNGLYASGSPVPPQRAASQFLLNKPTYSMRWESLFPRAPRDYDLVPMGKAERLPNAQLPPYYPLARTPNGTAVPPKPERIRANGSLVTE